MKIKFVKILTSLLLLITPTAFFTYNVNAGKGSHSRLVQIDTLKLPLSPKNIGDIHYLNSPKRKKHLIKFIEKSGTMPPAIINELKSKFDRIGFFFIPKSMYDSQGRLILRLWVPGNKRDEYATGTLYLIPFECSPRLRSDTI